MADRPVLFVICRENGSSRSKHLCVFARLQVVRSYKVFVTVHAVMTSGFVTQRSQIGFDLVTQLLHTLHTILCARRYIPRRIQNLNSEQTTDYYAVNNTCIPIRVDRIFMNIFFIVGSFLVQLLFSFLRIPHADKFCFSYM